MKSFIVFALLVAAAVAAPAGSDRDVVITAQEQDNIGTGPFRFLYQTSDGTSHVQEGDLTDVGTENEGIAVRGSYSYVVDGITYKVDYVADRDGFRPTGAHIPQ